MEETEPLAALINELLFDSRHLLLEMGELVVDLGQADLALPVIAGHSPFSVQERVLERRLRQRDIGVDTEDWGTALRNSLRQVEKVLDEYYADSSKRQTLTQIDPLLHQLQGLAGVGDLHFGHGRQAMEA